MGIQVEQECHDEKTQETTTTFAKLMEITMANATTITSINATMGCLKVATTKNAMSINSLVKIAKENATSLLTLGTKLEDIDMKVGTSIICLEHAIRANAAAIERLENALDLRNLSTNVRDIDTKVDAVRQDLDRHVGEVHQELDTYAALKPILDNVRYSQLAAIRDHVRQEETKSGADYTMVSDGVT